MERPSARSVPPRVAAAQRESARLGFADSCSDAVGRLLTTTRVVGDDARVRLLQGDWRLLGEHAPFDLFFCDGGGIVLATRR